MPDRTQEAVGRYLPLRSAYQFGAENGLAEEIKVIRDMEIEWDMSVM